MRPTLVTGANGHVGNNICRLLAQRGEPVRAMIRDSADPAPLHGLDVEVVSGDILDADAVAPGGRRLRAGVPRRGRLPHVGAPTRSTPLSAPASTARAT